MDFGTGIIGILFLLFCFIIFLILSRGNRKREKQLLQQLRKLAELGNFTISQYDIWKDSAIGIDKITNTLFVIRELNNQPESYTINLAEIQKCRVINTNKAISNKEVRYKAIGKVELLFSNRNKNKPETRVEFYNLENDSTTLSGELQLAEKWCKISNDNCKDSSINK